MSKRRKDRVKVVMKWTATDPVHSNLLDVLDGALTILKDGYVAGPIKLDKVSKQSGDITEYELTIRIFHKRYHGDQRLTNWSAVLRFVAICNQTIKALPESVNASIYIDLMPNRMPWVFHDGFDRLGAATRVYLRPDGYKAGVILSEPVKLLDRVSMFSDLLNDEPYQRRYIEASVFKLFGTERAVNKYSKILMNATECSGIIGDTFHGYWTDEVNNETLLVLYKTPSNHWMPLPNIGYEVHFRGVTDNILTSNVSKYGLPDLNYTSSWVNY